MNTPLLLIAWRRPHTLRQVIDAIRPVAPTRLFVACDGPNPERPGEAEKVAATRQVIETEIDWPCQIERLYSDVNQGCRLGVSRAITWFFEQVEEGIILEDDCVPHPDFFPYCTTLLERYRDDTRVWCICGSNFQSGNTHGQASYYFSIYPDPWGWATWRRAWQAYPKEVDDWTFFRDSGHLRHLFPNKAEEHYWLDIMNTLYTNSKPDTWDYRWFLTCWSERGLSAWPNANLVRNIGFDTDATHTLEPKILANSAFGNLQEISHPCSILPSLQADQWAWQYRFGGSDIEERRQLGPLYPWLLRFKQAKTEGLRKYLLNRILISFRSILDRLGNL